MAASNTVEIVSGAAVPLVVSTGVMLLARRVLPGDSSRRFPAALGFAAGFCAGYVILPSWAELLPTRHWHWLPYVGAAAAIVGPIGLAGGVSRPERWLLLAFLSLVAAWLIVPTWASLTPSRWVHVPALAAYFAIAAAATGPLEARVPAVRLGLALCIAAAVSAAMIAGIVSLTYGGVAGVAAAALAGTCLGALAASFWKPADGVGIAGLMPACMIVVGGMAFVGCIEPQRPIYGLLVAPLAPLALWVCALERVRNLRGFKRLAVEAIALAVPLLIAAGLVMATSSSGGGDDW